VLHKNTLTGYSIPSSPHENNNKYVAFFVIVVYDMVVKGGDYLV
jgi:hypothetical protein